MTPAERAPDPQEREAAERVDERRDREHAEQGDCAERETRLEVVRELGRHPFSSARLVEIDGERWLHKRFRVPGLPAALAAPLARAFVRRELANSKAVEGIAGVPSRARAHDATSLLREWVEGCDLVELKRQGGELPDAFFDELRDILAAVHARGIAYNDLEKKDNVLLDGDGHPVLIDFQISTRPYTGPNRLIARLSAGVIRELQRQDVRYLFKMKRKYRPDLMRAEEERLATERSRVATLYHPLWRVLHALKRLAIPKGSASFRRRRI